MFKVIDRRIDAIMRVHIRRTHAAQSRATMQFYTPGRSGAELLKAATEAGNAALATRVAMHYRRTFARG